jgi:hypothetical protein
MRRFAIPFLDVMTLLVLVLLLLIFAALMKISDEASKANIESASRYIVTMTWDDGSVSDIDLWVRMPTGSVVFFRRRQADFVSLDRDDLGISSDTVIDDAGNTVLVAHREEVDFIRQTLPGTYTVNVQAYHLVGLPVHVRVILTAVSEHARTVTSRELTLTDNREERTAFRFDVDASGDVVSTDTTEDLFANEMLGATP